MTILAALEYKDYVRILFALIIGIYAWFKFNTWPTPEKEKEYISLPRFYTTRNRFNKYALFYLLLTELLYAVIVFMPELFYAFTSIGNQEMGLTLKELKENSALYAALIIMGLGPNIAFLRNLEIKTRSLLHESARIPGEAKSYIKQLSNESEYFEPASVAINETINDLASYGLEKEWFTQRSNTFLHKWAKLIHVRNRLKKWSEEGNNCQYLIGADREIAIIDKRIKSINIDIQLYLERQAALIKDNQTADEHTGSDKYQQRHQENICEQLDEVSAMLYRIVVCGILTLNPGIRQQIEAFNFFGFNITPPLKQLPIEWNSIIASVGIVFIAVLVPAFLFFGGDINTGSTSQYIPENFNAAVFWSVAALLLHGFAMLTSILINRLWAIKANNASHEHAFGVLQPCYVRRLVSALGGFVVAIVIMLALGALRNDAPVITSVTLWSRILDVWQWALVPATTAGVIAYHFGVSINIERSRYIDGAIQGAWTGGMACLATLIAFNNLPQNIIEYKFLGFVVLATFLIGFAIGYILPEAYRRKLQTMESNYVPRAERYNVELNVQYDNRKSNEMASCNLTSLSYSGGNINAPLPHKIGEIVKLRIDEIGEISGQGVRKGKQNTSIRFKHDDSIRSLIEKYLSSGAIPAI